MLLARGIPDGVVLPRAGQASASLKLGAVLTAVILRKEQQSGHPATSLRSSRGFPNAPQESPGVRERRGHVAQPHGYKQSESEERRVPLPAWHVLGALCRALIVTLHVGLSKACQRYPMR